MAKVMLPQSVPFLDEAVRNSVGVDWYRWLRETWQDLQAVPAAIEAASQAVLDQIELDLTTVEADVDALQSDVTDAQADITALEADVVDLQSLAVTNDLICPTAHSAQSGTAGDGPMAANFWTMHALRPLPSAFALDVARLRISGAPAVGTARTAFFTMDSAGFFNKVGPDAFWSINATGRTNYTLASQLILEQGVQYFFGSWVSSNGATPTYDVWVPSSITRTLPTFRLATAANAYLAADFPASTDSASFTKEFTNSVTSVRAFAPLYMSTAKASYL